MLINHQPLLSYARNFRCVWIGGRFGGGKTTLAYRLAYDLMHYRPTAPDRFRYILSNCADVWSTPLDKVELRDKQFLDAVIILDEGGQFINRNQARAFLSWLRKINCAILISSFEEPPYQMRKVTVERVFTAETIGLPLWVYQYSLNTRRIHEKSTFFWLSPSEIFGVYSTDDFSDDESGILEFLVDRSAWIRSGRVASKTSRRNFKPLYSPPTQVIPITPLSESSGAVGIAAPGGSESNRADGLLRVGQSGGQFEGFEESAEELAATLSLYSDKLSRRGR